MRRFVLHRNEDPSGISGTGTIAQGVQFDDGTCVLRWLTSTASTGIYADVADLEAIHGHEGRTEIAWLDFGAPDVDENGYGCDCDHIDTLGGPDMHIEVHHVIPDDDIEHLVALDCPCVPQMHVRPPNVLVVDHIDQDAA